MRCLSALVLVNAARLYRPEVGPSLLGLLARVGQSHGTGSAQPLLTNGTEIEQTFVAECIGVVAVQFEEYLPLSAIRKMCDKVDRGTECREHAIRLVNTFRSPERDYATWCQEFYTWFKIEHGKLCPEQCNKFMCKPKCEWLDHIAGLDEAEAKLIQQEEVDQEMLRQVRALETEADDLTFEHSQTKQKLERSNKWVERSEKKLVEEQKRLSADANATAEVEAKAADRDAKLAAAKADFTALEDNRTKLGFAIDSAKIEDEGKARDARRMKSLAKEAEEELLKILGEAEHAGSIVEELEAKLAEEKDEINATNVTLRGVRAELEAELDATETKEAEQKAEIAELEAKVNKTREDETQIKMKKVLRKETSAKADKILEEEALLVKKEKALADKSFNTKFLKKDLLKAEDDRVAVLAEAEGLNTSFTEAQAEANSSTQAADAAHAKVETMATEMASLEKNITAQTEAVETAKVTKDFADEAVRDKQKEEVKRSERVAKVQKDLVYDDDENTRLAIREAKEAEELDALTTKVADKQHDYSVAQNATDSARTSLSAERAIAEGMDPGP
jgi:exonuclease SbcC